MKKLTITIAAFILFVIVTSAYSAAPANDMFAGGIIITGAISSVTGSNVDATIETGEPEYGNDSTVWWTWTAPFPAVVSLTPFSAIMTLILLFLPATL